MLLCDSLIYFLLWHLLHLLINFDADFLECHILLLEERSSSDIAFFQLYSVVVHFGSLKFKSFFTRHLNTWLPAQRHDWSICIEGARDRDRLRQDVRIISGQKNLLV